MFRIHKILNGRTATPSIEELPTTASETYAEGEGLVISSSGALTKAGVGVKPTYIAMADYVAPATGNKDLPCFVVDSNQIWEAPVTFSTVAVALVEGTKLQLDTDGVGVTDLTVSGTTGNEVYGVATIFDVQAADETTGEKILVRFV